MKRLSITPRDNWKEKCESVGMMYHTIDDEVYWDESACYEFTAAEIDRLEAVTGELHEMAIAAAENIIANERFAELAIPDDYVSLVANSWEKDEPSMYGRFDLCWNGTGEPKLLEYNADTPTSLLEASVVQWYWLKDVYPERDQFNSLHDKLIEFWSNSGSSWEIHFACLDETEEDFGNVEYIRDCAHQGVNDTKQIFIEDIGWDDKKNRFVDMDGEPIKTLFKLYPWEWMFTDEYGSHIEESGIRIIEPAWKSMLSNKGILAVMWELFPGHPNLLPTYFTNRFTDNYVRKPFLSREGESVMIFTGGKTLGAEGSYGAEGVVYQEYSPMPCFDGNYASIGSWIISGVPAGIGIREDRNQITSNTSRFVPHMFI